MSSSLVANRVTGQFEKDVLKVRENRAEIGDPDPILGQTMNHLGDQIVAPTPNGELRVAADDRLDSRDRSKALRSEFESSVARTTVRSGQCRFTRLAGVSMSMMRPCSMMATRSHNRSASSMR